MKQGIFLGNMRITKPEADIQIIIINILPIVGHNSHVKAKKNVMSIFRTMKNISNLRDTALRPYTIVLCLCAFIIMLT